MSDGGRESVKEKDQGVICKSRRGEDEYGRAIAKIAVAQICENLGFQSSQNSALDSLADLAVRYLRDLGKSAHFYANLAGRTDCNVFDIVQGLEDLGSSQGVSRASEGHQCIGSSVTVKELIQYVSSAEEIPFAQPVPNFPVIANKKPTPSFLQIGETPNVKHIPAWLPAFPDLHTYVHTPMWKERTSDPRTDKIEQARQRRKAERSLLSLQQRLACNGSVAGASMEVGDAGKAKQVATSNPYLAPPLPVGEKDVSFVSLPSKSSKDIAVDSRSSVMETFAPAIEAAKSGLHESGDCDKTVLPKKKPVLSFKFGSSKKSLGMPLDLTIQNNGVGKTAPWFGRDDEKDDKKRRAEQILKESMENPQELNQL